MRPIDVIPSRRLRHTTTGRTASLYGAHPATGAPGDTRKDWTVETVGWTVANDDGTYGCGRQPWATREGAEAYFFQHGHPTQVAAYKARHAGK
jgi:hypothetical protein